MMMMLLKTDNDEGLMTMVVIKMGWRWICDDDDGNDDGLMTMVLMMDDGDDQDGVLMNWS